MAIIGSFSKSNDGFTGTIKTLALNIKVQIKRVDAANDKAPGPRVLVGNIELGAGWTKASKEEHEYVQVKLDDPSFAEPVFANLVAAEDGSYSLIWSRK